MSAANPNRINISVPVSCKKAIDELVKTTGLFKGTSDFVLSAIMYLFIQQHDFLYDIFKQSSKMGRTGIETERLLKDSLTDRSNGWLEMFGVVYRGPLVSQITIRLNENLLKTITDMARLYLPNEPEETRVQKLCRIAIYVFTGHFKTIYESSKELAAIYDTIVKTADLELSKLKENYSTSDE